MRKKFKVQGGRLNPAAAGRTLCVVVVIDGLGMRVCDRRWFDRGIDALSWSRVREAGVCALKRTGAACSAFYSSGQEPSDAEAVATVATELLQLLERGR